MQTPELAILSGEMPETANFKRQVELNRQFEGEYPLKKFARLGEYLTSVDGGVDAKIMFERSFGFACMKASISAKLLIECQRCLQPLEVDVAGSFKFALLRNEEDFDLLPEEFEPYILDGEEQSIIDLIEDELILCLPMVTVHEDNCSDYMVKQGKKIKAKMDAEKESSHPFAALKSLKDDLKKEN